jgi:hypothetical protein
MNPTPRHEAAWLDGLSSIAISAVQASRRTRALLHGVGVKKGSVRCVMDPSQRSEGWRRRTWKLRSRACLADPPAESPSTRKISVSSSDVEAQSASFPGSVEVRSSDLRRTISRARFAASAACDAPHQAAQLSGLSTLTGGVGVRPPPPQAQELRTMDDPSDADG